MRKFPIDNFLSHMCLQFISSFAINSSFLRETVARTEPIVMASRQAAFDLHSLSILDHNHGFAGVKLEKVPTFLVKLKEKNIGANLGLSLDDQIAKVIVDCQVACNKEPVHISCCAVHEEKALDYSASGNLQGLRQLSLSKHSQSIRSAKDDQSRTCLHLAAMNNHSLVCKWLLTEVECDHAAKTIFGKTPHDLALENDNTSTVQVFERICKF